jgi:hypothetical protein
MRKGILLLAVFFLAAVFYSCKSEGGGPIDTSNPQSVVPDDPVETDSALWFSGIYAELENRNKSGPLVSPKTTSDVCTAINTKISPKAISVPASGTPADCKYLLNMIDAANKELGKATNYGTSAYAAPDQKIDQTALTAAVEYISVQKSAKKFVALSSAHGANVTVSHDGDHWYPAATGRNGNWRGVAAGAGKFAALSASTGKRAVYSADGINWTWATMPFDASWQDLVFGAGKFVAVASFANKAAYSADGLIWTETNMPAGASWRAVAYGGTSGNEKFAAIATNGSNAAAYSADGITWTPAELPAALDWSDICYGGPAGDKKFVAVSLNGGAAYSSDGITWTAPATDNLPSGKGWSSVCYGGPAGNEKFVAVSLNGAAYSSDGIKWTVLETNNLPPGQSWSAVCYGGPAGNEKFVAVAKDGPDGAARAAYSTGGITWTSANAVNPGKESWQGLAYGP